MSDPVKSWLNNAGRFPLLPKSEILRLASKRDTLEEGSAEYVKIINKLCQHNLKLVPKVVSNYLSKRPGYTMNSELTCDLLQQGYIGLRRAAEKYDSKKGFAFATYAYNWIFQSVSRWNNSCNRHIYVPENALTEALYRRRHGKPSSKKNGLITEETIAAVSRTMEIASLDKSNGEEDGGSLLEIMSEDNRIINRQSATLNEGPALELRELMSKCGVPPKAQDIVLMYARRSRMSIIASKMGMTEKNCRQTYERAMKKMRTVVEKESIGRIKVSAVKLTYNQPH